MLHMFWNPVLPVQVSVAIGIGWYWYLLSKIRIVGISLFSGIGASLIERISRSEFAAISCYASPLL